MRLSGWQRIGVVLSTLWFIVGGLWVNSWVIDELGAPALARHRQCLEARSIQPDGTIPSDTDWGPCNAAFEREFARAVANHWYWALASVICLPVPDKTHAAAAIGKPPMNYAQFFGHVKRTPSSKPNSRMATGCLSAISTTAETASCS
jgi:hypothetical protein